MSGGRTGSGPETLTTINHHKRVFARWGDALHGEQQRVPLPRPRGDSVRPQKRRASHLYRATVRN